MAETPPIRPRPQNQRDFDVAQANQKTYENKVEDTREYALKETQAIRRDEREVERLKLNLKKPHKIWLYPLFWWSFAGDALDIVLYFFPVIGQFVSALIDVLIITPMLLLLSHPYNKASGHNFSANNDLREKVEALERKVKFLRRRYASRLRKVRKVKFLRKPATKLALKFKGVRKKFGKSFLGKILFRVGLDLIPLVELWPWRMIGVWKAYRNAVISHEEALASIEDYHTVKAEAVEATNDTLAAEQEEGEEDMDEDSRRAA